MHIIKLNAIASTNDYLKQLAQQKDLGDLTVVVCDHQTSGRGQKGNSWVSEEGKNLTLSVLKRFSNLRARQGFSLNCLVSLAIFDVLQELSVPDVRVKWPNDIMSVNKKICGILIENTLQGTTVQQSIIGVGLNVNQTNFGELANASSVKLATGRDHDLDEVLNRLLHYIEFRLKSLAKLNFQEIIQQYEAVLFRMEVKAAFRLGKGQPFKGTIKGVTESGQLKIERENGQMEHFNFKEVTFIY